MYSAKANNDFLPDLSYLDRESAEDQAAADRLGQYNLADLRKVKIQFLNGHYEAIVIKLLC